MSTSAVLTSGSAIVVGAVLGAGLWATLKPVYASPLLARTNIHGRDVPTAGGLVIVLAGLVAAAGVLTHANLDLGWLPDEAEAGAVPLLTVVLGFGFLGLVDDLLGDGSSRGFRGHLSAMSHGRLTTGGVKLVGGGVVALVAVMQVRPHADRLGWLVVDVALLALAANLANLFDRAPGRVTKVATLCTVALVLAGPSAGSLVVERAGALEFRYPPVGAALVVGAALGVVLPEMRERMMLGDTGANAIGAALGLATVTTVSPSARLAVLVALVALNLASEKISFSRVIASTPGLRHFDQFGRVRE